MAEEQEELSHDPRSMSKSVLFLGGVALIYFVYLVLSGNLASFVEALGKADARWVFAACLSYVAYFFLGVFAYWLPTTRDKTYSHLRVRDLMSVEATGIFFSNLSPNGTGAPPAQIWRLTKCGLSIGQAGALQYTRFIIYETAEGVFAALMLIPRYSYFVQTYGNVILVGIILFGCKIIEVSALLAVCLFPQFSIRLVRLIARWLSKSKHLSRFAEPLLGFTDQIRDFSAGFKRGIAQWRMSALTMAVTLVQLGCQYALPWFVLRAFGVNADLVTCLACGSMLELLTSAVPLPGGTGGAEGGFAYLFGDMFGPSLAAGYVVWRLVEYILPVAAALPLSQLGLKHSSGATVHPGKKKAPDAHPHTQG